MMDIIEELGKVKFTVTCTNPRCKTVFELKKTELEMRKTEFGHRQDLRKSGIIIQCPRCGKRYYCKVKEGGGVWLRGLNANTMQGVGEGKHE